MEIKADNIAMTLPSNTNANKGVYMFTLTLTYFRGGDSDSDRLYLQCRLALIIPILRTTPTINISPVSAMYVQN